MLICNKNYRKLNKHLLCLDDKVVFTVNGENLHYIIRDSFLNYDDGYNNAEIFERLKLDAVSFCTKHYGYTPPHEGIWPYFKEFDFEAITRTVKALFEIIENGE